MPRYRAMIVRRNGGRGALTIDALDLASLAGHVEGHCKAYVVSARRLDPPASSSARVRVPDSLLLAALDSLELMLASGVRVNAALRTLAEFAPAGPARALWTGVTQGLEESGSFSGSIRRFPRVFNPAMAGVIEAHESAGRLPEGVRRVRDYIGQMRDIRRESMRGVAYPAVVFITGLCASVVLCVFTLPRFAAMLRDIGMAKMNRVTAFFFGLSDVVNHRPGWVIISAAIPMLLAWAGSRPRFRPRVDRFLLGLPVVRGAVEALAMARVCATFRALSSSGIRVVDALESCAVVAGNHVYASGIGRVIAAVRDNATVGEGFERAGVFAPEVVLAVKSAEGSLPEVFGRLAEYYSCESRHRVALALRMVEPVMLVIVLAWVFGVALAVILPVVEIVNEIH